MKNLYIISFNEPFNPMLWDDPYGRGNRFIERTKSFIKMADPYYKTILVGNQDGQHRNRIGIPDVDFMSHDIFSKIKFTEDDLVIFWGGSPEVMSRSEYGNIGDFYESMIHASENGAEIWVLALGTAEIVLHPSHYAEKAPYKPFLKKAVEMWTQYETPVLNYLIPSENTMMFRSMIEDIDDAHDVLGEIKYLPLHILPMIAYDGKQPDAEPFHDNYYVYYAQRVLNLYAEPTQREKDIVYNFRDFMQGCYGEIRCQLSTGAFQPPTLKYTAMPYPLDYDQLPERLNRAMATVVFADKDDTALGIIPQRIAEGIASKTFVAIDSKVFGGVSGCIEKGFHPDQIFGDGTVYSKLGYLMEKIVNDPELRLEVIQHQTNLFDSAKYHYINLHTAIQQIKNI